MRVQERECKSETTGNEKGKTCSNKGEREREKERDVQLNLPIRTHASRCKKASRKSVHLFQKRKSGREKNFRV